MTYSHFFWFHKLVLKQIVIFAIQIVASLTIEYRIIGALTHTQTHVSMHTHKHTRTQAYTHASIRARKHTRTQAHTHASTHARMHTSTQSTCGRWYAQLAANLLFANNLEVFPYRIPPRHRFTSARHIHTTIEMRGTLHEGRLHNYMDIHIRAVTFEWYCNDQIFEYYSFQHYHKHKMVKKLLPCFNSTMYHRQQIILTFAVP